MSTKTKYQRMYDLLYWIVEHGVFPVTLTEWGRAVGLKRTPYLKDLVKTLIMWGAVEELPNYLTINGFHTTYYQIADRDLEWFDDMLQFCREMDSAFKGGK